MQHGKNPPELAWNEEGERYDLPDNAVGFKVRRFTGKPGKPPAVWVNQGILHLPLDATMDDLRLGVGNEPGSYRLYPVDDTGRELSPPAYVEVVPDDRPKKSDKLTPPANGLADSTRSADVAHAFTPDIAGRFFDLHERMLTSRDAHDALMANLLTTLVTTTAQIQQSTARLLGAANTTIKIANGVEAIERAPVQIDADAIAAHITEAMAEEEQEKPQGSLIAQLVNGPLGMSAIQLLQGFSTSLAAAQKAKFAADAAAQQQAAQAAAQAAAQQQAAQAAAQAAARQQAAQAAAQAAARQQAAQAAQQAAQAAATAVYADDASTCPEDHAEDMDEYRDDADDQEPGDDDADDQEPSDDDQAEPVTDIAQLAPPGAPCQKESTHRDSTATASHSPQPHKARGTPQPGKSRKPSQKRGRKRNQRTRR